MSRPFLTVSHKKARVEWCQQKLKKKEILFGRTTNTAVVHIDEKWFKLFLMKRLLYLPASVHREEAAQQVVSRGHVPKVMFLAAVGYPR